MNFYQLSQKVFQLHRQEDYRAVYDLVTREAPHFPDAVKEITHWRICLLARMGRRQEALDLFADLLATGQFIGPHMLESDSDLDSLRSDPLYQRMAAECQKRYEAARVETSPHRQVEEPVQKGDRVPLLMALHSNGSNAAREAFPWRPVAREGWWFAMLQSSQLMDEGRFGWNDQALAVQEVQAHFKALTADGSVDASRVLIGGMSMGAGIAVRMALTGEIPVRGFLVVAPWLPDLRELKAMLAEKGPTALRGYIIIGGQDTSCLPIAHEIKQMMAERGLACELEFHPDMAHVYPDDFEQSLQKGLAFLLADE